jgi:hypothetical protein
MFQRVNEGHPQAECQQNQPLFNAMRRGQFNAWSSEVAVSYLLDLERSIIEGRNLVAEKYINMMKNTHPSAYEKLSAGIVRPSELAVTLADEISDRLMKQSESLARQFPRAVARGRPLRSDRDKFGVMSVESYQKGELTTYSENTLYKLLNHIDSLERNGVMFSQLVLENYAKYYGHKTLKDAEESLKTAENLEIDNYGRFMT